MKRTPLWRRYDRIDGTDVPKDVQDELRFHIESKTEELEAQGWNAEAARQEAERQFGDVRVTEQLGEQIGGRMERRRAWSEYWAQIRQDMRYALRTLAHQPTFALVSIGVLALGIGANVAIFSVVDALVLRPLPFPQAHQLVWFTGGKHLDAKTRAAAGLSGRTYNVDAFEEFRRHNRSFASVTTYQTFYQSLPYKLTGNGKSLKLSVVQVAGNFFPTLGVAPALGRNFTNEECVQGGAQAALLSHAFWKSQFASDPAIIGKTIEVNGTATTVVGVLPASFDFGSVFAPGMKVDLFVPAVMNFWRTWGNTLAVVGRLKPGVTVAQAQQEADLLFPELKKQHQGWFEDYASELVPLKEYVAGKLHRALLLLWAAAGVILLIVCVNLSNLQLARTAARGKELAMRCALGAGRWRLVRQLLTENLAMSTCGAVLGLGVAWAILFALLRQKAVVLPLLGTIGLDATAMEWGLLLALAMGLVLGMVQAVRFSRASLANALKSSGLAADRRHGRFQSLLVVAEIALACILLVNAGLLLRSFQRVLNVDLGFEPGKAMAMEVDLDANQKLAERGPLLEEMLGRVRALPGVESAGISDMLPLGRSRSWKMAPAGSQNAKEPYTVAFVYMVTPGYLSAAGIKLLEGRDLRWQDKPDTQHVVVLNQAAARSMWPGKNPIGQTVYDIDKGPVQVVGVVADVHESSPEEPPNPEVYIPMTQNSDIEGATLIIRTHMDARTMGPSVLETLRALNPAQTTTELRPLQLLVDHAESSRRFFVLLASIFACLGVGLATLGIYGVTAYAVSQKTQEIGVRMALGATAGRVQRDIVMHTLRLAVVGMTTGVLASLGITHLMESLLFEISPWDAATYAGMVATIVLLALASGYLPARRAARIDPMAALRTQ
ncbi:MAG TPA: ABC transporter permease [Terracidiphilus sp.]|nr:ABC transporter permease [Terracidiphilus sp.]